MAFPQAFMDELIARSDILDVVGSYVPLTAKSGSYWGCCPFHNEKTASFHVLQDRQFYHCFGCKKGGDVIHFIMDIEGLTFPDAVHFLARRAGMNVPEDTGDQDAARKRKRMLDLNRDAARFFYEMRFRPEGAGVQEYLERRQISQRTAKNFGMGAAPDSWDSLLIAMTQKGYSKSELLSVGLVVQGKNGKLYDKFRNRLMLPVIDIRGDVVAFGGRVLDKSEPKYMNSPESPVYSKRRTLYGLNLAKKSKRPNIILCEGNLDIVTLHQAGFDNAVASMGTALTTEQLQLLSRFTKELVLCYDNDNAGKQATERALQLLNNTDFTVRVLQLPRRRTETGELVKQDADDFIKNQGPDAFERLLTGSENGIEFRMAQVAGKYDLSDDPSRVAYCEEISNLLAELTSAVEREVYTVRAAEAAKITPDAMRLEVERAMKRKVSKERKAQLRRDLNPAAQLQPQERSLRYENVSSARAEEGIIRLLLLDDGIFPKEMPLAPEKFSAPLLRKAYSLLWAQHAAGRPVTLAALASELTSEEMSHLTCVCQQPESTEHRQRALADYIRIIENEHRKRGDAGSEDPLLAAMQKYRKKTTGTGGKYNG